MAQISKNTNVPSTTNPNNKVVISSIQDFQKKVKFADKDISYLIHKIVSTLDSASYHGNADIGDSLRFLLGATLEVAIQYNPTPANALIRVSPGDVVSCKFGTHVDGEISGTAVHSIVCDIQDDGTVFLLPITKQILDGDARKFMLARAHHDIKYFNPQFNGGTVLLRMGKYVRPERISIIVGKTSHEFFESVLRAFHDSMDFSLNLPAKEGTYGTFLFSEETDLNPSEEVPHQDTTSNSGTNTAVPEGSTAEKHSKKGTMPNVKKIPFEEYMQNFLTPILDNINDPDFSIEDKVSLLISELQFEDKLAIVHDAFVVSCEVPRVTMQSILTALHKIHKSFDKETLKTALFTSYEQWLCEHPDIQQTYPNTSILTMFKVFASKMK